MGVRYFRRGKTRAWWVPTISNKSAPTAAEIAAGTEVTSGVSDITGFATSVDRIGTPDLSTNFTSTVPGEQTVEDSELMFYLDSATNPLRTTMAVGNTGYIVFIDYKPTGSIVATDKVDVYPVIVGGIPKERDMGNTAAKWTAQFGITAAPAEDVAVV